MSTLINPELERRYPEDEKPKDKTPNADTKAGEVSFGIKGEHPTLSIDIASRDLEYYRCQYEVLTCHVLLLTLALGLVSSALIVCALKLIKMF